MGVEVELTPVHGIFDVEFSPAKDIIFSKIGLHNGTILKF